MSESQQYELPSVKQQPKNQSNEIAKYQRFKNMTQQQRQERINKLLDRRRLSIIDKEKRFHECYCNRRYSSYPSLYLHMKKQHMEIVRGIREMPTYTFKEYVDEEGFKIKKAELYNGPANERPIRKRGRPAMRLDLAREYRTKLQDTEKQQNDRLKQTAKITHQFARKNNVYKKLVDDYRRIIEYYQGMVESYEKILKTMQIQDFNNYLQPNIKAEQEEQEQYNPDNEK